MAASEADFSVYLATTDADLRAAQALRYEVFVAEMGADGAHIDHEEALEKDGYDAFCDHMLIAETGSDRVVGVYRLLRCDQAKAAGGFYSQSEYDLTPLTSSGRKLLELGRSCLHPDFRGGTALMHLWAGLSDYVMRHNIEVLFGVASFPGKDLQALAGSLSALHYNYLAPEPLRCRSRRYQPMNILPADEFDRRAAMINCPALIKAYLRLGGVVGDGAYIDEAFNTTDVCMILDTARMSARQKRMYGTQEAGQ